MSFRWSFSTDKLFRRCQRQFFFREIAAHHSQKEPWRREAFVLKQLKTLELWRGSVRADEDNALFGGTLENDEEPLLAAAK